MQQVYLTLYMCAKSIYSLTDFINTHNIVRLLKYFPKYTPSKSLILYLYIYHFLPTIYNPDFIYIYIIHTFVSYIQNLCVTMCNIFISCLLLFFYTYLCVIGTLLHIITI